MVIYEPQQEIWGDVPLGDMFSDLDPFIYLLKLVELGLKPLGQWAGPLTEKQQAMLAGSGLARGVLRRLPPEGGEIVVTIFSRDAALVRQHVNAFDGASLISSPERLRLEGAHFGYPSCCVENFIMHGQKPNGLPPEVQGLLFHWACPDCVPSRQLAESYRVVYDSLRNGNGHPYPQQEGGNTE